MKVFKMWNIQIVDTLYKGYSVVGINDADGKLEFKEEILTLLILHTRYIFFYFEQWYPVYNWHLFWCECDTSEPCIEVCVLIQ